MVAASSIFLQMDECDRPDKHRPVARTPGPAREMVRQPFFSRVGDAPPAVVLLLLLLTGDVETNPGPSCYACSQNFRQSDMPLTCHTPDCEIRTHRQTHCSGLPRSQQSLPWHCPTHGGPGPPVNIQTPYACYSCHQPFRQGTRPFACFAQGCTNLAHAAKRCNEPIALPDQWRYLHRRNGCRSASIPPHSS